VDQDVVYHLSILDPTPSWKGTYQYRTVIRVALDDESQQPSSRPYASCRKSTAPHFCTLEYVPFLRGVESLPNLPTLYSSLEKSFSVTWTSNAATGGSYCLIPIKFRSAKRRGSIALKLIVGTEKLRIIDATMSYAEKYEEGFACVRLFSEGDAQAERAADIAQVEHTIKGLQAAMERVNDEKGEIKLTQKNRDKAFTRPNDIVKWMTQKSEVGGGTESVTTQIEQHANLAQELLSAHKRLSLVRPVQVFRAVVSAQDEHSQFHMPSQQVKHCGPASSETNTGKFFVLTRLHPC
jgi:hypothetical protein